MSKDKIMKRLVHGVVWPAVGGNILWSLLYVLADSKDTGQAVAPRIIALFAIGFYLMIDWCDREAAETINSIKDSSWKIDAWLAFSLATFAIATYHATLWAKYALGTAFIIAIIGHYTGAWNSHQIEDKDKSKIECANRKFAIFNFIGFLILVISLFTPPLQSLWVTAISISVVVVLFLCNRKPCI